MPWLIGIDEAGYGPNLGPLVMTAVAYRVPPELAGADLWSVLQAAVRRQPSEGDGRILVEDSKVVYSPARGLLALERGVLATSVPFGCGVSATLHQCIDSLCQGDKTALAAELWYTGQTALPVAADLNDCAAAGACFEQACRDRSVSRAFVQSVVICPAQFNRLLDQWQSKGAALAHGLTELVRACWRAADREEDLSFCVDKHGGRNTYAAMLQQALPEGMVVASEEGMERSVYGILGLERDVRLTFQPRADAEHFCVALASMVSKYLREVLMLEFNRFWQGHLPELKPTAGYPGDAARFFAAIRPTVQKLGLAEDVLWRRR